jgi:hypothetical protein
VRSNFIRNRPALQAKVSKRCGNALSYAMAQPSSGRGEPAASDPSQSISDAFEAYGQAVTGIGKSPAGVSVATETCGQVSPAKLRNTT